MESVELIYKAVLEGDAEGAKAGVDKALKAGQAVDQIMQR